MGANDELDPVEILAGIEVPDCGCPATIPCGCNGRCDCPVIPAPPCEHLLSRTHNLTLEQWAAVLMAVCELAYREPPLPAKPSMALTREARVELLAERRRQGEALWHPGDVMPEDLDRLGRAVGLTPGNNRTATRGIAVTRWWRIDDSDNPHPD